MITKDDIKQFCDQCYFINALYKEYIFLYESNKKRSALLDKTARDFFSNLQGILIDRILLNICKITDADRFKKNDNLTIKYILKDIEQDAKKDPRLDELSNEIHEFRKYIVDARHKIIVHLDLETLRANKTLGAFPRSEGDKFWKNLQEIVNIIHKHYFDNETFIFNEITDCRDNAEDLILALKKAAYFDKHFKNVIHDKLLEEEEFEYRNA